MMTDHIAKVAGHFAGKVYSWDVVNGRCSDPMQVHRPDGLRETLWLRNCGERITWSWPSGRPAAAADLKALLVWNEDLSRSIEWFWHRTNARAMRRPCWTACWLAAFPSRALELEAHLRAEQAAVLGDAGYEAFLGQLARRGMKIFITELDVQGCNLARGHPGARDQAVAAVYNRFLTATLRQPTSVEGIVTWGLADRFTWICGIPLRVRMGCRFARSPSTPELPTESRVLRYRGINAVRAAQRVTSTANRRPPHP